jgi:hypothetical protein
MSDDLSPQARAFDPEDSQEEGERTGPPLTGSRRRGPDERRALDVPVREREELLRNENIYSRQIALAYEREAIRLRRHRLQYPFRVTLRPEESQERHLPGGMIALLLNAWTNLIQSLSGRSRP